VDHLVFERPTYAQEALIGPDGRWIGEEFDVSYVPSGFVASLLAGGRTSGRAPAPRSILAVSASAGEGAIGIPPSGEPFAPALGEGTRPLRGAYTRADARLEQLPRLPYAGREVSTVARRFAEATVVQGSSDVESRLWKIVQDGKLARYDVLHVAGHALTDVAAERCGLVLSESAPRPGLAEDGVLDVEEMLLGWNFDMAPFVTFSGCETAVPAGVLNNEMLGFVPVALAAGARNILASLWPADDRATELLMERFYENLTGRYPDTRLGERAAPLPPARALREAKSYLRSLKDRSGRPIYEHPVYWAGFILIGIPDGS
jgi:CHAT domain-containing protein